MLTFAPEKTDIEHLLKSDNWTIMREDRETGATITTRDLERNVYRDIIGTAMLIMHISHYVFTEYAYEDLDGFGRMVSRSFSSDISPRKRELKVCLKERTCFPSRGSSGFSDSYTGGSQ